MSRTLTPQEANIYAADKLVGKSLGKEFAERCSEYFSETYCEYDIETEYNDRYRKDGDTFTHRTSRSYLLFSFNESWTKIQVYAPDLVINTVDISGGQFGGHYIDGHADEFSEKTVDYLCSVVLK